MGKTATSAGLTFVELLIVVSIITVLSAAAIPGFNTYITNQNLKQSVEQIKSDLRTVQNNVLGGAMAAEPGVEYWGIDFSTTPYRFKTYDFSGGFPSEQQAGKNLVGDVEVKNAPIILFEMFTGNAFVPGVTRCDNTGSNCSIIIGASSASGNECSSIRVNSAGALLKVEGVVCP